MDAAGEDFPGKQNTEDLASVTNELLYQQKMEYKIDGAVFRRKRRTGGGVLVWWDVPPKF